METRKVVCAEWKYRRDDGCFSPYTPKTAAHLELARANGASSYWVDFVRTVHFEEMVQRNSRSGQESGKTGTTEQIYAKSLLYVVYMLEWRL